MALEARVAQPLPDLAGLLDALAIGIAIVDSRSNVEYLNASAQTLLAAGINHVRGRPLAELIRDSEPIETIIARAREGNDAIAHRELKLVPTARRDRKSVV